MYKLSFGISVQFTLTIRFIPLFGGLNWHFRPFDRQNTRLNSQSMFDLARNEASCICRKSISIQRREKCFCNKISLSTAKWILFRPIKDISGKLLSSAQKIFPTDSFFVIKEKVLANETNSTWSKERKHDLGLKPKADRTLYIVFDGGFLPLGF